MHKKRMSQRKDLEALAKEITEIIERESPKIPREFQRVGRLVAQHALEREPEERLDAGARSGSGEVLVPSVTLSSLDVDELSRDRMANIEGDVEEIRTQIYDETEPPFGEPSEDCDPRLAGVIDSTREVLKRWLQRDRVETRGERRMTEVDIAVETEDALRQI